MIDGQIPTVLGPGAEFEGLLSFRGAARVDGKLSGDVVAEGCLVIGEGARVHARIEVDELIVGGRCSRERFTRESAIELLQYCSRGGITPLPAPLAVAEGGILEGRCEAAPGAQSS